MNDFVRDSWQKGESGGGSSGSSNVTTGDPTGAESMSKGEGNPTNFPTQDPPPPTAPRNPDPKFDRDDNDPLTDSPGIKGSNKKRKRRKGKRDLRRGGFLSSLKIDRGSSMGGSDKKNPYSIGGM